MGIAGELFCISVIERRSVFVAAAGLLCLCITLILILEIYDIKQVLIKKLGLYSPIIRVMIAVS
jgi:hypothetical protein